ncbi:PREDICTED: cationic amino acid transporter 2, vacuolar-like isoform X2 [Populus euphratica]|uniref:Cationic amino acid transporter 2, vacuolar-like isoform X2 n=1 Tax=Populus euphratica TaxID=75702 RepID=A0AAJ6XX42_POPEU|nr:PREDICTED: cationic amino acid transporter 2, vacuolar-like isoform X2 [Populus euphratica]
MGFLVGSQNGVRGGGCFRSLIRRKQVDSVHFKPHGHHQLAKELSVPHLTAIGVGSTIGAGIYILVGTVAREHSGPALFISFLVAGIAAALSAFCYAELASRCPSAGSAYHYSYICVGEGVAWLIGWALILEYTIGGSAVARGISPNLALFFGGRDSLPFFLARQHIPGLDVVVDPCAAVLVLVVTGLLCVGIKESILAQAVVTSINVCAMLFIIIAGSYLGFKTGWAGYELPAGYFPFGVDGMLAGSATVFFAYIGFDSVASTAEEVKNPQRDLPLGIGLALSICCCLYMLVSVVIVGLVPYYAMDPDTPISSAFAAYGMQWAAYLVAAGAVMALCSTLMGSILPQVSVGTLLAFTMVAISVLILRYVPPNEVPFPSSLQEIIDSVSLRYSTGSPNVTKEKSGFYAGTSMDSNLPLLGKATAIEYPIIVKQEAQGNFVINEGSRRKIAGWTITATCVGAFLLAYAASDLNLPRLLRFIVCGIGLALLLFGLIVLTCIEQDDERHNFGHSGGFICPFVPLLPIVCFLVNIYLLINLGAATWTRVSVWLIVGVLVYTFYGRTHSSLLDAVYVPATHADEIYRSSGESSA